MQRFQPSCFGGKPLVFGIYFYIYYSFKESSTFKGNNMRRRGLRPCESMTPEETKTSV